MHGYCIHQCWKLGDLSNECMRKHAAAIGWSGGMPPDQKLDVRSMMVFKAILDQKTVNY